MSRKMNRIYLSSPHMGGEELNFIHDAFDKNWIAPLGANVNNFEEDLQNYTGRKQAAVVTSGTAAIHLGLILCGVEPGDEVICQSFTFAASANPIRYQGATPVFVDSEPETWNMDPGLLEKAIVDRMKGRERQRVAIGRTPRSKETTGEQQEAGGRKPKAIVVVHLYGMPARMDEILKIAVKYDIPVIEDAAEALGSTLHGRSCGSFGKLSVLSFNGNKIITTSGGGALLGDDENVIQKARFLATQARDDAPHYQHSELGYNYRMSNIVAGVGRGQMKVLDTRVMQRRANHDFYFKELGETWFRVSGGNIFESARGGKDMESLKPGTFSDMDFRLSASASPSGIYFLKEPEGYMSNRWLTTILVNPAETGGVTREDIRTALEKENIECRPLWKPMHLQPLYSNFPFYKHFTTAGNFSGDESKGLSGVSGWLFEYGLCLPSGSNLNGRDRERVVDAIRRTLKNG